MKIEVNIEKKYAFVIISLLIIIASLIFGYAYRSTGTGGVPSTMGHSIDEIDWSKTINSNVVIQGNISSSGVCINGNCKTDWSEVTSSAALGQIWYIANGNPGITFTFPSAGIYLIEASGMINTYAEYPGASFFIKYGSTQIGSAISPYHRDADSGGNSPGNWPYYQSALTGNVAAATSATLTVACTGSCGVTSPIAWKITKVA
jgi:hypothetical protein